MPSGEKNINRKLNESHLVALEKLELAVSTNTRLHYFTKLQELKLHQCQVSFLNHVKSLTTLSLCNLILEEILPANLEELIVENGVNVLWEKLFAKNLLPKLRKLRFLDPLAFKKHSNDIFKVTIFV